MSRVVRFPHHPASGEYDFDPVADLVIHADRSLIVAHGVKYAPHIATYALMEFDFATNNSADDEAFTTALNAIDLLAGGA
jgi:hypothetical protein